MLCQECLENHKKDHKFIPLTFAFSDQVLDNLKDFVVEKQAIYDMLNSRNSMCLTQIDKMYDDIEKKIFALLQLTRYSANALFPVDYDRSKLVKLKIQLVTILAYNYTSSTSDIGNYSQDFSDHYK